MLRLSLELAAAFLLAGVWLLWVVHVPVRSPSRLSHLSRQQRKRRVRVMGWLCMTLSVFCLIGAIVFYIGGS